MKINWKWAARGVIALAAICAGIYWGSMKWLKVSEHEVPLPRLPEALDGLRVLHLTDLHSYSETKMNVNIWTAVDDLAFDMAVITGDMILGREANELSELKAHLPGLTALAARVPTFFAAGNHDYHSLPEMAALLESIGITVLQDQACTAAYNGTEFTVIGTLDAYHYQRLGGFDSLHEAMAEAGDGFRLVLSHQPQVFDEIAAYAPDLMLSGHTHGGQIRLPFFPTLYAPGQGFFPKYGDGFYRNDDTGAMLYISRGIGTTVVQLRFWNRPEITVLTLKCES